MKERLKIGADLATIVAAVVAACALGFGYLQFREILELQAEASSAAREATAVRLYLDYLKQVRESQGGFPDGSVTLTVAEHLIGWRGDDPGWRNTAARMIEDNRAGLEKYGIDCSTIGPEFQEFLIETLSKDVCG